MSEVIDGSSEHIDRPTFDTTQVVNWNCPNCGEPGFDDRRSADYYPVCTNMDCPVKMFSVFRGENDN